ncbi:PDZ domain-containing protein [Coralloluteibacterium stylophorae]|uniref:PDZ domain-containing protein n=1 Tax=Coralloluteibacterium stylophorae TaxID=1776034 RepID=A0A8J7VSA1_9GAMM|nr:PDZ domain-containing protein [Coralloluteibacterium stylophorae]MBS7458947.1 PDZ domain-containing protein [Coralloluteibacterium stylophorae]
MTRVPLLLCALLATGAATAAPPPVAEAVDAMLLSLADRGALPDTAGAAVVIERPAQTRYELGAVVDLQPSSDPGLRVLAVTPGAAADRLGLRSGDRLLGVNGSDLGGADEDALASAVAAGEGELTLRIARGGRTLELAGRSDVHELPAYRLTLTPALEQKHEAEASRTAAGDADSRCARVSVFDVGPRSQQLYRAVLIAVDGRLPGPSNATSFRIEPGRHTLTVAEAIDADRFSSLARSLRGRRSRYKELQLDARAGVTYRLAARLVTENRERILANTYWEPVLWSSTDERCR